MNFIQNIGIGAMAGAGIAFSAAAKDSAKNAEPLQLLKLADGVITGAIVGGVAGGLGVNLEEIDSFVVVAGVYGGFTVVASKLKDAAIAYYRAYKRKREI